MKKRTSTRGGFTLIEIMIVIAIIGLLMTVAVPNIVRARKKANERVCLMNIENIEGAKQLWATENRKSDKDTPTEDDLRIYLRDSKFPTCPSGGTYTINAVDAKATCSVHVSVGDGT